MVKILDGGQKWLDSEFGSRGVHDLHIKVVGGPCGMGCLHCKGCRGQVRVAQEPPRRRDVSFSAGGYNFTIDPKIIEKAVAIQIDASGGIPMVRGEQGFM